MTEISMAHDVALIVASNKRGRVGPENQGGVLCKCDTVSVRDHVWPGRDANSQRLLTTRAYALPACSVGWVKDYE